MPILYWHTWRFFKLRNHPVFNRISHYSREVSCKNTWMEEEERDSAPPEKIPGKGEELLCHPCQAQAKVATLSPADFWFLFQHFCRYFKHLSPDKLTGGWRGDLAKLSREWEVILFLVYKPVIPAEWTSTFHQPPSSPFVLVRKIVFRWLCWTPMFLCTIWEWSR